MNDEDRIVDLLAEALAVSDRGEPLDLPALCGDRPDLIPIVAESLRMRGGLPVLHDDASVRDPLTGRVLAERYRLEEMLGQGAVGMVFRARDLQLPRDVAIKLLHHGLFVSPEVEARFRREAEVLAQHEHPHVLRIYDQGKASDGTPFLVTELLRGTSLQTVLEVAQTKMQNGPSSAAFATTDWLREMLPEARLEHGYLRQLVVWTAQLAEGLAATHAHGVFHRDVKPSNIFIRSDGSAVLLDFGIAARAGDAAMTLPHAIVGTPWYMAPEQAEGRSEPRPALDVYGLSATLYHMLTFTPPHEGDLRTVLAAVRTADPTPARWLHKGLPRDLQAILDGGLERDLDRRYADVEALRRDLVAFLDHRPVSVRPIGSLRRWARTCRHRPARTAAFVLAAGLVAAVAVVVPLWATVEVHAAARERADLLAHLPGDLCIEGYPDQRLLVPLAERSVVLAELDRLLELDKNDLSVRLLRANERLDAGDATGAAADFAELQHRADSDYLREVATRYAALAARRAVGTAPASGAFSIHLENLPVPSRPTDFFVAGFHALRNRDCDGAEELLTRCVDFLPARDLRLLASLGKKRPDAESVLAEAGWLEGHYGRPTARTRHAMAVAMLLMRRYDVAIGYSLDSLRLRPDRHGPWNNLGLAYLRTGQLAAAKQACERAVAIRPWFANSRGNLAQTLRELGDFDGAKTAAEAIDDIAYREHELGNLAVARAILATAAGDETARIRFGNTALGHFLSAAAVPAEATTHPRPAAIPSAIAYATVLAGPDRRAAVIAFLHALRRDATNPQQVANAAGMLRDLPVDDRLRDELRLLLLEVAAALAPGKAVITAGRDALRDELNQR